MQKGVKIMSLFSNKQSKKVVVAAANGGYTPAVVKFKTGKPAAIDFVPKGDMGCMNEVVFKDLDIDVKLDGKKRVTVDIPTDQPGTYNYACGMDMFHGKVIVE